MIEYYRWNNYGWQRVSRSLYEVRRGMALLDPTREERLAFYDTSGISLDVGGGKTNVVLACDVSGGWTGLWDVSAEVWRFRTSGTDKKAVLRLLKHAEEREWIVVS